MNGLVGYFPETDKHDFSAIVNKMLWAQGQNDDAELDDFDCSILSGCIGVKRPADIRKQISFEKIVSDNREVTCYLLGEVYRASAHALLQQYLADGRSFLDSLNVDGIFAGVIVDSRTRHIHLFTDPFGLLPVYYLQGEADFAFATEIKSILVLPDFNASADLKTFFDFWTYGFALGDKTPVSKIKVLPGGSLLSFDCESRQFEINKYYYIENLFLRPETGVRQVTLDSVADAFYDAVQVRSDDVTTSRMGLSLSGGLDSRTILAGMGEKSHHLRTYTLGLPGCADQKLASRMAEISGTHHDFIPIEKDDLGDFESLARLMVFLSDGLYHPHESTERVALNYLATDPFDIMLRGHGGEIAKASLAYPFQATLARDNFTPEEVIKDLYRTASLGMQDMDWKTVFTDSVAAEIKSYGSGSLQAAAQPAVAAGLSSTDICVYLYISQWIPRQVVASLALFRSQVNIRLPYLDRTFLEKLLQLPVEERWGGDFHRLFVKKFAPGLVRVPDANTGAPLSAGAGRLWVTDKINSVLRRIGMPGFRHYTDFQSWQRKYFSGITKEILFDSRSLSRNYYDPKGLRTVFDLHVANKKNYAHFLGTAVAIELWHRIFLEEDK